MYSIESKYGNFNFNFGNRMKSTRDKPSEYGSWLIKITFFWAHKYFILSYVCTGALSCKSVSQTGSTAA